MDGLGKVDELFTAKNLKKVVKFFRAADCDGSEGLDVEEFSEALQKVDHCVSTQALIALHFKIDANCDMTVDLGELLGYLQRKKVVEENLDYKRTLFPNPFFIVKQDTPRRIIRVLCLPVTVDEPDEENYKPGEIRRYQDCNYLSVTVNGILNCWNTNFEACCRLSLVVPPKIQPGPFAHPKKITVNDMVFMKEANELVVSTSDSEVMFFTLDLILEIYKIRCSVAVKDAAVSSLEYWSDGAVGLLIFGDNDGSLTILTSSDMRKKGFFSLDGFENVAEQSYPSVSVSKLLKNPFDFSKCYRKRVFYEKCSRLKYLPQFESVYVCSKSSERMGVVNINYQNKDTPVVFQSKLNRKHFSCVEFCSQSQTLVTGGADSVLRVWSPFSSTSCLRELKAHSAPVTHISYNPLDRVIMSASVDMNVRVWSEDDWQCKMSFYAEGMRGAPLSAMCYNLHNNEILLANNQIGRCLGRGTESFKSNLSSHESRLCTALYHSHLQQVVSVSEDGFIKVWDILSGKAILKFRVSPEHCVGDTAMSFDETNRKLVTISPDGRVRMWNFNSGQELSVHPVIVPSQVSAIICQPKKLFVSAVKCQIIWVLDLQGENHQFLKHRTLCDISSMAMHAQNLIAMSSQGNVVIWDHEYDVICYLLNEIADNVRVFKQDQVCFGPLKSEMKLFYSKSRASGNVLPKVVGAHVVCLKNRGSSVNTATLLAMSDGFISAWSVETRGGLISKFRAVIDDGAYITAESLGKEETILLTGDSKGRICLWDIQFFGIKKPSDSGPFETMGKRHVSTCSPPLLCSWQTHNSNVVSIVCNDDCKIVFTSQRNDVTMWTSDGHSIGIFGKDEWTTAHIELQESCDDDSDSVRRVLVRKSILHEIVEKRNLKPPRMEDVDIYEEDEELQRLSDGLFGRKSRLDGLKVHWKKKDRKEPSPHEELSEMSKKGKGRVKLKPLCLTSDAQLQLLEGGGGHMIPQPLRLPPLPRSQLTSGRSQLGGSWITSDPGYRKVQSKDLHLPSCDYLLPHPPPIPPPGDSVTYLNSTVTHTASQGGINKSKPLRLPPILKSPQSKIGTSQV